MSIKFGSFLVEKGKIDESRLAAAVVAQQATAPTSAALALELGLLGAAELLQVLDKQSSEQCGFKEACQSLGLWTEDFGRKILDEAGKRARPLIAVLAEAMQVSPQSLVETVEEFLSKSTSAAPTHVAPSQSIAAVVPEPVAPPQSVASIVPEPVAPPQAVVQSEGPEQLVERQSLLSLVDSVLALDRVFQAENPQQRMRESCDEISRRLLATKGAARFAERATIEAVAAAAFDFLAAANPTALAHPPALRLGTSLVADLFKLALDEVQGSPALEKNLGVLAQLTKFLAGESGQQEAA